MAQVDLTTLNPILKDWYTDGRIRDATYKGNKFLGMMPKVENYGGRVYVQPVQYGENSGRSRTHATAMARKGTNSYKEFRVDLRKDYNMLELDRMSMMLADGQSRKSFFEAKRREVDGTMKPLRNNAGMSVFRGKGGARSVVGSFPSATVMQLAEIEDIVHFEVGDVLVSSENNGNTSTDTLQAGSAPITAIDRSLGRLTTNGAGWVAQIPLLDAGDFLFKDGDFQLAVDGLDSWIPQSTTGLATSFNNVVRTDDTTRLAGHRATITSLPVLVSIQNFLAQMAREGASPETCLVSVNKFRKLEQELESNVVYTDTAVTKTLGYRGIKIIGQEGDVTIHSDRNCPDQLAYLLTMESWKLISPRPVPEIQDDDGNTMLRSPTSDGYEIRCSAYYNLVCDGPGENGVLILET